MDLLRWKSRKGARYPTPEWCQEAAQSSQSDQERSNAEQQWRPERRCGDDVEVEVEVEVKVDGGSDGNGAEEAKFGISKVGRRDRQEWDFYYIWCDGGGERPVHSEERRGTARNGYFVV